MNKLILSVLALSLPIMASAYQSLTIDTSELRTSSVNLQNHPNLRASINTENFSQSTLLDLWLKNPYKRYQLSNVNKIVTWKMTDINGDIADSSCTVNLENGNVDHEYILKIEANIIEPDGTHATPYAVYLNCKLFSHKW